MKNLEIRLILVTICILIFVSWGGTVATKIKLVIIGDSITMPENKAGPWPKILQELLGDKYEIVNKAVNGRTMIAVGWNGDQSKWPYVTTKEWPQVFEEKPHIVTIMLGSNDTKDIHWIDSKGKERYKSDYLHMVDTLLKNIEAEPFSGNIPIKPKIVLLYPPVIKGGECWKTKSSTHQMCDSVTRAYIIPYIRQVAEEMGVDTVNLNGKNTNNLFAGRDDVYRDGLHLNEKGAKEMAEFLAPYFEAIKKEDFVGCKDTSYKEYSAKATTHDVSMCKTKNTTGLVNKAKPEFAIKPSPGKITVLSEQTAEISLTDLKGKSLRSGLLTAGKVFSLSTEGLSPGVYTMRITTEQDVRSRLVFTGQ